MLWPSYLHPQTGHGSGVLRGPRVRAIWEQSLRVACRLRRLLGYRSLVSPSL